MKKIERRPGVQAYPLHTLIMTSVFAVCVASGLPYFSAF